MPLKGRARTALRFARSLAFLLPSVIPFPIHGQERPPVLRWGAEVRPRSEIRRPVENGWDGVTSMRTRISLDALMEPGLRLVVQIQDVRDWGEESSVRDRNADAVDFHQAFLEVAFLPAVGGLVRAGRQEVGLAEQRLVGAPDWGQAGQTFDGARWIRPLGEGRLELVYLKIREDSSPSHDGSADLTAAWYSAPLGGLGSADLLGVHDRGDGTGRTRQTTVGGVWRTGSELFSARAEGLYQFGRRGGRDVEAFMFAGEAGMTVARGQGTITLWYDYLSGDAHPDDDEIDSFSTLFGARNRYYGRADYFTDVPTDTRGLGLVDAALKLAFSPGGDLSLNLDLHEFRTAQDQSLTRARLGEEADLWARVRARQYLTVQAGYSLTWSGPAMEALGLLEGTGHFGYVMTSLRF